MSETYPGKVVADSDLRAHIYTTAVAIGALLVAAGFLTADEVQLWLNLAAAGINLGAVILARLNTRTKR